MSDKSVNVNVEKHEGNMLDQIFEIGTGGVFGSSDYFTATVTVGDRQYTANGQTYDEALSAAKEEAGI